MVRRARYLVVLLLAVLLMGAVGCQPKPEAKLEPKIAPPAVAEAGVLRVGVDLSTPPFAGKDGQQAGIDVDVAAALAEKLGLTVEFVDIKPSEAASALAEGNADAVFSVRMAGADLSNLSIAGAYIADAPGLFIATDATGSVEPSLTLDTLPGAKIGAQTSSESYWILESEFGTQTIQPYDSLRDALDALDRGDIPVVAGDAVVGAYIARDFPRVRYGGRIAAPYPLGVAVAAENNALSDAVRTALDELAADGVLENVRRKWVGDLPELKVEGVDASEGTTP